MGANILDLRNSVGNRQESGRSRAQNGSSKPALRSSGKCEDAVDWTKHGRAAPFKRNDVMLAIMPAGGLHFPGTGMDDNLADKAKKLGIPVWRASGVSSRQQEL